VRKDRHGLRGDDQAGCPISRELMRVGRKGMKARSEKRDMLLTAFFSSLQLLNP
jgi:hypothetical protein